VEFHDVINRKNKIENAIIIYSFSQKPEYRAYIVDVMYYLLKLNNIIIPGYELLKCHENKGFQELYSRLLGVNHLPTYYFSDSAELTNYTFEFPLVYKTVDGSNGKGVTLVKNDEELLRIVKKHERIVPQEQLDLFRRKYLRKKRSYKEYPDYNNRKDMMQYTRHIKPQKRFVLQQFIPDLMWDFRVLVVYDRYYITKRHIRDNDFRASGAKKFDFDFTPDPMILDFAKQIFDGFRNSHLSIDIAFDGKDCYLLEYQALHFGINVLVKSDGFYEQSDSGWRKVYKKPEIEEDIVYGFVKYLNSELIDL
jgi:glutathione synthase/RimK-type ligase-like ATP-grasp enzyme